MSDNLRRYCAIHSALLQLYPREATGNLARHLKTLAALVCGIVGSKRAHLPAIASKAPDGRKRESRATGWSAWALKSCGRVGRPSMKLLTEQAPRSDRGKSHEDQPSSRNVK